MLRERQAAFARHEPRERGRDQGATTGSDTLEPSATDAASEETHDVEGTGSIDDGGSTGGDPSTGEHEGDDSTGDPVCPADLFEIIWVDDAQIESPMYLTAVSGVKDEPSIAVSTVAGQGRATFTVSLPCAGEYHVWGLVWDYWPGAFYDDPDSFHVDVGLGESIWLYGCQTSGGNQFSWQRLHRLAGQPCAIEPVVLDAPVAGEHELSFRNREAGSSPQVAGISAIVISTNPTANPYELYTP